jgi:hypothetical protein
VLKVTFDMHQNFMILHGKRYNDLCRYQGRSAMPAEIHAGGLLVIRDTISSLPSYVAARLRKRCESKGFSWKTVVRTSNTSMISAFFRPCCRGTRRCFAYSFS